MRKILSCFLVGCLFFFDTLAQTSVCKDGKVLVTASDIYWCQDDCAAVSVDDRKIKADAQENAVRCLFDVIALLSHADDENETLSKDDLLYRLGWDLRGLLFGPALVPERSKLVGQINGCFFAQRALGRANIVAASSNDEYIKLCMGVQENVQQLEELKNYLKDMVLEAGS
jgi:hypothetical protein